MICRLLFVLWSFFCWPLCCLSFLNLRILYATFVPSNSFYTKLYLLLMDMIFILSGLPPLSSDINASQVVSLTLHGGYPITETNWLPLPRPWVHTRFLVGSMLLIFLVLGVVYFFNFSSSCVLCALISIVSSLFIIVPLIYILYQVNYPPCMWYLE